MWFFNSLATVIASIGLASILTAVSAPIANAFLIVGSVVAGPTLDYSNGSSLGLFEVKRFGQSKLVVWIDNELNPRRISAVPSAVKLIFAVVSGT